MKTVKQTIEEYEAMYHPKYFVLDGEHWDQLLEEMTVKKGFNIIERPIGMIQEDATEEPIQAITCAGKFVISAIDHKQMKRLYKNDGMIVDYEGDL